MGSGAGSAEGLNWETISTMRRLSTGRDQLRRQTHVVRVVLSCTQTCAILVFCQQLDVRSTAIQTLLQLDFVLYDQGLLARVNRFGEEGRDGVMSGFRFYQLVSTVPART